MRALVAPALIAVVWTALGGSEAYAEGRPDGRFVMVPYADEAPRAGGDAISNILFVNRCVGGCEIIKSESTNNALTNESQIPAGGVEGDVFTVPEFAHGDAVWEALMDCLRDTYGPYDVMVTDVDPGNVAHHEAIASGTSNVLGLADDILGIAPGGCDPRDNVISFSFLNEYPASQVLEMCATVAQESAHSFGVADHAYDCTDPMTYLSGCGQKFFRNKWMPCGEFETRECLCTDARMNPHVALLDTFGPGTSPAGPTVSVAYPDEGATINTFFVQVDATDPRGVYKIELLLNGWLWATFEQDESITPPFSPPTSFQLQPPNNLPNGVYDIEVRAYNDLGSMGVATRTATKGAPCADASSCLPGQQCEAGKCSWDPPTGQIGDACEFAQQCVGPNTFDGRCEESGDTRICTQECFTGANDFCPDGFTCLETNAAQGTGVCWFADDGGGCCSTARGSGGAGALLAQLALVGLVGGFVLRRRSR